MKDSQVSEGLLIERLIKGDKAAQTEWWLRDYMLLLQYIRKRLSVGTAEDCEEIAQESFLRALVNIRQGKFEDRGLSLQAYLRGIAHYQICDFAARRKVRGHEIPIYTDSGELSSPVSRTMAEDDELEEVIERVDREPLLQRLAKLLTTLPEVDRNILRMVYNEEMNSNDIGKRLGMKPVTVRQRLSRAKQSLYNAMLVTRVSKTRSQ